MIGREIEPSVAVKVVFSGRAEVNRVPFKISPDIGGGIRWVPLLYQSGVPATWGTEADVPRKGVAYVLVLTPSGATSEGIILPSSVGPCELKLSSVERLLMLTAPTEIAPLASAGWEKLLAAVLYSRSW